MKKINNIYGSQYYEYLAAKTLARFVFKNRVLIELSDKPDLRVKKGKIGIEVTRGTTDLLARYDSFCNMYFNQKNSKKEINEKAEKMKVNAYAFGISKTKSRGISLKGPFDLEALKTTIATIIDGKISKIAEYDRKYRKNCIYVFCGWTYEKNEVLEIVNLVKHIDGIDVIYFDCNNNFFKYESKKMSISSTYKFERRDIIIDSVKYAESLHNRHLRKYLVKFVR
ncbi:MAG: hypothetical protein VB015_04440 [Erysipelotrichaceae bacterium]|nr:hypothetical protein [Erysipelotrichaceae bacterium]